MNSDEKPRKKVSMTHFFLLLLVIGCVSFFIWSFYGKLDIVSVAEGEVIPTGRVKHVQHLEGGIIREIAVKEGDRVQKGQPVIILERTMIGASLDELNARVNSLKIDIIRLQAVLEDKKRVAFSEKLKHDFPKMTAEAKNLFQTELSHYKSGVTALRHVIKQRKQRLKTTSGKIRNAEQQLALIQEQIELSEELLKDNLTTRYKHLELLNRAKKVQGKIADNRSSLKELQSSLDESQQNLEKFRLERKKEAGELLKKKQQELKELSMRIRKYEDNLKRTVVRSPINGVVKKIHLFTEGGVIQPGDTIADIVPVEEKLIIEAHLAIKDIGYVKKGQTAHLLLPSRDSRKFGKLEGTVKNISPDTFTNERGRTYYNVRIESEKGYFKAGGIKYNLYPGMIVMAYIHIGKRTVLDYLLDPFFSALSFTMQER